MRNVGRILNISIITMSKKCGKLKNNCFKKPAFYIAQAVKIL